MQSILSVRLFFVVVRRPWSPMIRHAADRLMMFLKRQAKGDRNLGASDELNRGFRFLI